ncbi:MAG: carbon-nitrogen hydrolase family protein [Clostridia bacterium]|nr:carbon-nitrogen hydrolase family protein [Clostridia bacterium]
MKNIVPPLNSGSWKVWTPKENKMPIATYSDSELSLCSKSYTDCGMWVCEFDVTPGQDYEFSVEVRTERIDYNISCVRAIVAWLDSSGELMRCDYAIYSEKLDKHKYKLSKHVKAPNGPPYQKDAVKARMELLLWNTDSGKVTFTNPVFEESLPVKHRIVRVATTYISPYADDAKTYEDRLKKIIRTADEAGKLSPDIVCFSECIATRELRMTKEEASQTVPGPLTDLIAQKAKEYNCYMVFNLPEVEDGFFYNTSVLIDREGNIAGKYHKVHLTYSECTKGTTSGRTYPVFQTDFGKIGLSICFDHFFPESIRQLAVGGAEMIFVSTAGDGYMQSTARAMDNGIPICISCVNHAKASPWPQSRIVKPDGVILAGTMSDCGAAVASVDLDDPFTSFWFSIGPAYVEKRDVFLSEARPDTYKL